MKHRPQHKGAYYLQDYVKVPQLRWRLREATKLMKAYDFDAIAFRGMSGALVAASLALRLRKNLLMVRKPSEKRHSFHDVEGDTASRRYIIVDDFMETGKTVRAIRDAVKEFAPQAKCLGVFAMDRLPEPNSDDCAFPGLLPVKETSE